MKIEPLIIDSQNDFCDPNGSLFVPGANEDTERLAQMIKRLSRKNNNNHDKIEVILCNKLYPNEIPCFIPLRKNKKGKNYDT